MGERMITTEVAQTIVGYTAYDNEGNKLGKISEIYFDDDTSEPAWITVHTGLFGTKQSFVPLAGAAIGHDENVTVGYSKDQISDAPRVDADEHLSVDEENELYRYYGLADRASDTSHVASDVAGDGYATSAKGNVADSHAGRAHVADDGHDTSGPETDDAMTRSEEQLRVGTQTVETGRVRLRKHIVTENVTTTVPVSHEEVHIEREPITEANRDEALSGGDLTSEEHEVTLHAEQPVVDKETVPVERVRLSTDTVTGEEQVNEQVRKEEIDTDGVDRTTSTDR
jgi:uncharacterized protein (TIGR02271 family)